MQYTTDELKAILDKHAKWLRNEEGGERADLRWANLRSANLSWADLRSADLSSADLRSANLRSADLSSANLSSANLRSANLSSADLRSADLSSADLRSANLRSADLSSANLSWADGQYALASLGRHQAIAAGGYISIGCERHTYQKWLDSYQEIGKLNGYTDAEISRYGAWIKLATDWLIEAEKEQEA